MEKKSKANKNDLEHIGKDIFKFANDDAYAGQYRATKKEEIFRQGFGQYFCNDGSIYDGVWNADYLENVKYLKFSNSDVFRGFLHNFQFSGEGVYDMAQVGIIKTVFDNNYPIGEVDLIDPCGFRWMGVATKASNDTILYPLNHFKIEDEEPTDGFEMDSEEESEKYF